MKGVLVMTGILDRFPDATYHTLRSDTDANTGLTRFVYKIVHQPDIYILKTIPCKFSDANAIAQARQEYEIPLSLSQISNHIIKPIAMEEFKDTESEVIYIEMLFEYGGESLATKIGTMQPAEVLSAIRQTLDALALIESKGIFHSDVKPENLVVLNGRIKLTSFGISKDFRDKTLLMESTGELTGRVIGQTWRYSAPEICNSNPPYHINKIDVYAWAMTFYQLITGTTDDILSKDIEQYRRDETAYADFMAKIKDIHMPNDPTLMYTNLIIPVLTCALNFRPDQRPDFALLLSLFGFGPSSTQQELGKHTSHSPCLMSM